MRRLAAVSVLLTLGGLSSFALAQAGGAKGWIDQPLAASVITSTPVKVTAHLTHPAGVTEARLVANGADVDQKSAGGETLETVEFLWQPPGPGEYLLEVFGFGGGGWGTPGSVLVIVAAGESSSTTDSTIGTTTTTTTGTSTTTRPTSTTTTTTPTSTTRPTTTTSTTTTSTTTTTVCSLGVPSIRGATGTDSLTPTLSWSYGACQEPEQFEVHVSRSSDFARLEWSGAAGEFSRSVVASVGSDCTSYYWRVRTYHFGDFGSWSSTGSFFVQTVRSCP